MSAPAPTTLQVLLQPLGRLLPALAIDDPDAWRQVMGHIRQDGVPVSFIRAEMGQASWTAMVPSAWHPSQGAMVTLQCQSLTPAALLLGWSHFC